MLTFDQTKSLMLLGAAGYAIYLANKTINAAEELITEDLNPLSQENIIYGGVSDLTRAITGSENTGGLGSMIYDWFN